MTTVRRPRGALNISTKKTNPKQPDWYGTIEIAQEDVKYLVGLMARGEPMKLRLSGWNQSGPYGKFISVEASQPYVKEGAPRAAAPAARPAKTVGSNPWGDEDDDSPF